MVLRKTLLGLASAGLVFGSTAAVAAPAEARTGSVTAEAEGMAGLGTWGLLLGLLIVAGVIAVVASDDDDVDTAPVSP